MMRRVTQDVLGDASVLRVVEVDIPVPGPTEILVEMRAGGRRTRSTGRSALDGGVLGVPPFTVGWELSGVVAAYQTSPVLLLRNRMSETLSPLKSSRTAGPALSGVLLKVTLASTC